MFPSNLKVLAKFGLCSNCSQKLDDCSLARAWKIFATACMLGFSLNSLPCSVSIKSVLETKTDTGNNVSRVGETSTRHECFWKNASSFC